MGAELRALHVFLCVAQTEPKADATPRIHGRPTPRTRWLVIDAMAVNADPTKRLRPRTRLSMPGKTDETPPLVPSRPAAKAAESSPLNGATQPPRSAVAADRGRTGHAARDQQQAEEVHLNDRLDAAKKAKAKLVQARRSKRQAVAGESIGPEEAPQQERKAKGAPQPEKLRAYHDALRSNSSSAAVEMHNRAMLVESQKNQREVRARQAAEEKERRAAAVLQQAEARKADMARVVAEERARRKAEEKAKREAAEKVRQEAEEVARKEAEEEARLEAEEVARREEEERLLQEAEERARQEVAQREAAEQARQEAEEEARREAQEAVRREEEERVRQETEERAQQEALAEAAREEAHRHEAAEAAMLAGHEANKIGAHALARRSFCEASALQPRPAALVSAANMARRTRIA